MERLVVRVVDGRTRELVCEVDLDSSLTFRRLAKAAQAASGMPGARIRLVWAGRSLRAGGDSSEAMSELRRCVESTVVKMVLVDPRWEAALDRLYQSSALPPTDPGDQALLRDRGFVLALVQEDGCLLRLAPEELRSDLELVQTAVRDNGRSLSYASKEVCGDKATVLLAVSSDGAALEFASASLRSDPEVVAAAVQTNGEALRFAAEQIRLLSDVCLRAVQNRSDALQYAHPVLLKDVGFLSAAVGANGDALQYAPRGMRELPEVMLAAKQHWSGSLSSSKCDNVSIRGQWHMARAEEELQRQAIAAGMRHRR